MKDLSDVKYVLCMKDEVNEHFSVRNIVYSVSIILLVINQSMKEYQSLS